MKAWLYIAIFNAEFLSYALVKHFESNRKLANYMTNSHLGKFGCPFKIV